MFFAAATGADLLLTNVGATFGGMLLVDTLALRDITVGQFLAILLVLALLSLLAFLKGVTLQERVDDHVFWARAERESRTGGSTQLVLMNPPRPAMPKKAIYGLLAVTTILVGVTVLFLVKAIVIS